MPESLVQYESDIVLRDGSTLHLRPIEPRDAPALLDLYTRLSPESLYYRFFSIPKPDPATAERLAHVNYAHDFALAGECGNRIVAVARYYRDPKAPDRAEAAFVIEDALQGRGLGTKLLERLADIARAHRITTFDGYVLADNRKMMQVFVDSGFEVKRRFEGGVVHVELSLKETAAFEAKSAERSQKAAAASMKVFFEPRVIAVVGANRTRGHIGAEIFHNLRATGFRGTLIPVNLQAASIESLRAYPRVTDIPGDVDLAVIAVPAGQVEPVIDDCIAKRVRGVIVISAGFGEAGSEGREKESVLVDKIRAAGIRMIGPNCMGVINTDPAVRLNATFSPTYPPEGRVAFSSQSGALGLAILDYVQRLNVGISTFVSVGNKADVSGNDLIQYWGQDPRTDLILLYLESFGNPHKFSQIARRVGKQKPIVAVKAGRSHAGARAASSHTGALAASDAIVDALFRQAGVIRTGTLEELFDVATLLAHQPIPAGPRVGILTNAGGPGILAADACEGHGLVLPALGDQTVADLRTFLPAAASVTNPVDLLASASAEDYRRAMRLLLSDPHVDSLVVIFTPPLVTEPAAVAAAIVDGAKEAAGKPVLATFMSTQGAPAALAPIPCYVFPESASTALARAVEYGAWRRRPAGTLPEFDDVRSADARDIMDRVFSRGGGWLTPAEAQDVLDAFGVPVAAALMASTEEDAVAYGQRIGFPVVLKAVGPTIVHKTEVGAVKLGLTDEAALREAYRDLADRLHSELTGVLVQRMVPAGVEMFIGALQDPTFGPVILCGTGGTLVELLGDTVVRLQPLTDLDAEEMLNQMKGVALLRGYRGAPAADETALREALLRLSLLLEACPEIQEMDINPIKVLPKDVCVIDARIRVERRSTPRRSRRICY